MFRYAVPVLALIFAAPALATDRLLAVVDDCHADVQLLRAEHSAPQTILLLQEDRHDRDLIVLRQRAKPAPVVLRQKAVAPARVVVPRRGAVSLRLRIGR